MQHQVIVKLLLFTGMRRGELCGLEWKDIDFERAVITVRRSSLYLPGKGIFEDETKNATSERCMKVSADVVTMLKAWRAEQSKQHLRMGDQWQDSDRLFTAWYVRHKERTAADSHSLPAAHQRNAAHCRRYEPDNCCGTAGTRKFDYHQQDLRTRHQVGRSGRC